MIVALAAVLLLTPPPAWSVRWVHGEKRLEREVDLSSIEMLAHGDLLLVSEPYLPSHCGEVLTYRGSVAAFDRRTGQRRWTAPIPQSTGDQAAFLRSWSVGYSAIFATNGVIVALDARGRLTWRRANDDLPEDCRGGPTEFGFPPVEARAGGLIWDASETGWQCRLDGRSGRVTRGRFGPPKGASAPAPPHCTLETDDTEHLLGGECADGWFRAMVDRQGRLLIQRLR